MSDLTQKFEEPTNFKLYSLILIVALVAGIVAGFVLAYSANRQSTTSLVSTTAQVKNPLQKAENDTKTFKDFYEGTIQNKPSTDTYSEGTHILVDSNGKQVAALTSSVLDLNQYVGKKVKVYGETQKALKQGWLMDVGKIVVEQ